jgi:hypothetical protein
LDPATDESTPFEIFVGIFLVLCGAAFVTIGMHLWKWSHETETKLPLLQRWRWWLGLFFSLVLLLAVDMVSYALLPLSLVAPFGAAPIFISAV